MKNYLFFLLIISLLVSCKKDDKTPTPDPTPPLFGLNQQAPFGRNTPKAKLHEVFYNGKLLCKYIYTDGSLLEVRNYVTYNSAKPWFTRVFKRNGGLLESYEEKYASFSPEARSVADLPKEGAVLKLETPKNDSVQEVVPVSLSKDKYHTKIFFNAKGLVVRVEEYNPLRKTGYVHSYERDNANNIVEVVDDYLPETQSPAKSNFRYDKHPNPFFDTGIYWQTSSFSNYALTPHNVIEESGPSVQIRYEGKDYHVLSHEYEYLPSGYPSRDTAYITVVDSDGKEQKVVQRVLDYTYY